MSRTALMQVYYILILYSFFVIQGVKNSFASPPIGGTSISSYASGSVSSTEFLYMQQQVADLQQQLRFATADLHRLEVIMDDFLVSACFIQGEKAAALSARNGNLRVPNDVYGRISLEHANHMDDLETQRKAVFEEAMRMKDAEAHLNNFKPDPKRGSVTEQRAEWLKERNIFEQRANTVGAYILDVGSMKNDRQCSAIF